MEALWVYHTMRKIDRKPKSTQRQLELFPAGPARPVQGTFQIERRFSRVFVTGTYAIARDGDWVRIG